MKEVLLILLLSCGSCIGFSLSSQAPECFLIPMGYYELEFMTDEKTSLVECTITDAQKIAKFISPTDNFEGEFILNHNGSICFRLMEDPTMQDSTKVDNTIVYFDFFEKSDPLGRIIDDTTLMKTHSALYDSFLGLEMLYRDQHFLLENNEHHGKMLDKACFALLKGLIVKVLVIIGTAWLEYIIIRLLVDRFDVHRYEGSFEL